jgi:hypothetical protein
MPIVGISLEEGLVSTLLVLSLLNSQQLLIFYGDFIQDKDAINLNLPCHWVILVDTEMNFFVDFWLVNLV